MILALRRQKAREQIEQFWAAMQRLGFTREEAILLLEKEKEEA